MIHGSTLYASPSGSDHEQGAENHRLFRALATIIQDLAAFAGLFAIDTVERNALATELGYGVVTTSALSILGILGLLKSSFKLALGLELCRKSGFAVDSLRSIYGYMEDENAGAGIRTDCDEIDIRFKTDCICIKKTRQYFDSVTRPIITVGSDFPHGLKGKTAINLGNPVQEMSLVQHPVNVALVAFFVSGITSWLLAIIAQEHPDPRVYASMAILQASLFLLVGVPLCISFRIDRPGQAISRSKLATLVNGNAIDHMTFMQYPINSGHALFFYNNVNFLSTKAFAAFVLISSAICAAAYTAQFLILKLSDPKDAGIWVGCQALLAAFRLAYCIVKRPYDRPNTHQAEYVVFENQAFDTINLISFSRSLPTGSYEIPLLIWNYLCGTKLKQIMQDAFQNTQKGLDLNENDLFFINADFVELSRYHESHQHQWQSTWTIALVSCKEPSNKTPIIKPILFIENPELALTPTRVVAEARLTWTTFPKILHSSQGDTQPENFDFKDVWFLDKLKATGFVPRKDLLCRQISPGARGKANEICRLYLTDRRFRTPSETSIEMFHCATTGVVPRDGDGFTPYDPPYYICQKFYLKQAIELIQEYVDIGRSRRVISRRNAKVFHPTTSLLSLGKKLQRLTVKMVNVMFGVIGLELVFDNPRKSPNEAAVA